MSNIEHHNILTLSDIWDSIVQQFTRAINDRKHPFRLPILGTTGEATPNMRIVVLRKFQKEPFIITAYTDVRSQKVAEIKQNPNVSWLFWNGRHQVQIRASGDIQIEHQTARTQQIWDNMHFRAKATYLALTPPSSNSNIPTNGLPEDFSEATAKEYSSDNFCILHSNINYIEWLKLDKLEHRRASFTLDRQNQWRGTWLIP